MKLTVRVSAKVAGRDAVRVTSAAHAVGKVKPAAKLNLKKKIKKGKRATATATFSAPGLTPNGTAVVKVGKKTVAAVKVNAAGKVKLKLPKLKVGKHKVTVTLLAGDAFKKVSVKKAIKVRR
ncbi:Ig-like domain repeat protein [Nocardioides alcanivorans]|uniref:Ig-like domain repeat protein n=1 Tax=Nocardioides alcanivorans TaxID=2897352 RepID=UPI001F328C39|nr:Ig-like domain repeat protein [Nocardioides alcanivorans]